MAVHFHPQPKPSKGKRLRTKQAAKDKAARDLSLLYRKVYTRDQFRCVACGHRVIVGSVSGFDRAHPHHIIPRSKASKAIKHTTANICTLDPICHSDVTEHRMTITGNADQKLVIVRRG